MYRLTISRQDGSRYWTEYFNSEAEAEKWLNTEKTRSYWKKEYESNVEYIGPTAQEIAEREAAAQQAEQRQSQRAAALRQAFRNADSLTDQQVRQTLKVLIGYVANLTED